ncbi:zinc-ribbon domain-containing protein [Bacillus thuringiensis]|uniref:zinc-ribbon domain-containing protein n=1 Tax=Bacillus thuringiensis TaxID=1428 RepID=UPI0039B73C0A
MAKITIDDMKELARSRGGECLSSEYKNGQTSLKWKCNLGHTWEARPNNIKSGKWCPTCGIKARVEKRRGSIDDMKQVALSRGGICLSDTYINNNVKLKWRCKSGHEWEATPSNIKAGKWCPKCAAIKNADKKRKTIRDMKQLAASKGGKCLSNIYVNMKSKLLWECANGHEWEALPSNVYNGKWCPKCAGRYRDIEDMRNIAKKKNGKCLSFKFADMKTKLRWQCERGHEWEAAPNHILNSNSWCPMCIGNVKKDILEMKRLAQLRNGSCLSKVYVNIDTNLVWECSEGHHWEASPYSVSKGSWCPICNNSNFYINEEKCRFIMESLLGKDFAKTRNTLDNGLELDGYNEDLSLAFEYNGTQHYHFNSFFHKDLANFEAQKQRDIAKGNQCKDKDIRLVVIPYYITSDDEKVHFIKEELEKLNVPLKRKGVKWNKFYKGFNRLDELKSIAKEHGGKCLSEEYVNVDSKLKWVCEYGHEWEASAYSIKKGAWCPKCLGRNKTIEDMNLLAKQRGGECLSSEYINNREKLKWKCKCGHIWLAAPHVIIRGSWCPRCSGRLEKTIEDMQDLAIKRGGRCLSEEYINIDTKLKWQCERGHEWETVPRSIQNGTWCPRCSGRVKSIVDMQNLAELRNGKCRSLEYISLSEKLEWECEKGHRWKATSSDIRRGRWCLICSEQNRRGKILKNLHLIAAKNGGECLSHEYIHSDAKLTWRCKYGHEWEAVPYGIQNGSWCPKCSKERIGKSKRLTIKDVKELAVKRGGECLSKEYINNHTKLLWRCREGHEWEAAQNSIQNGSWCPKCQREFNANRQRKSIEDMLVLASKHNGKCLSDVYINAHEKLLWECKEKHQWWAKPNNVQQGKWCPKCSRIKKNRIRE